MWQEIFVFLVFFAPQKGYLSFALIANVQFGKNLDIVCATIYWKWLFLRRRCDLIGGGKSQFGRKLICDNFKILLKIFCTQYFENG